MSLRGLALLLGRLRVAEPWRYKAPFLIAIPYFMLLVGGAAIGQALVAILWALCTIVGIAGFAYLSNDVADRAADRASGRPNGTSDLSTQQTVLAFVVFLAAAIVPWTVYFTLDAVSLSLLAAEFALLIAYSVRPVRLKERGAAGLVVDALYAHAVPAVLAAYTFHLLTARVYVHFPAWVVTLGTWQFVHGLRSVLSHQLSDADWDRAAGTTTYVTSRGHEASMRVLCLVLVPLELAALAAFTTVAALSMPLLAPAWPVYAVLTAAVIRYRERQLLWHPIADRLDRFLNEYYLLWFPLVVLLGLCLRDPRAIAIVLVHVAIFRSGLTPLLEGAWFAVKKSGVGRLTASPAE